MKYLTILYFFLLLCGCHFSGELRTALADESYADYYKTAGVSFHGYVKDTSTTIMIPLILGYFSEGSRESVECHYYDNRYVSVSMPASNYGDTINARIKLQRGTLLEGEIIAAQSVDNSVRIDFYFPVSCEDMQNATFYLRDADKELLAVHTYYKGYSRETTSSEEYVKLIFNSYSARINYYEDVLIDVLPFGLQERFVSQGKGWLTLVFRKSDKDKTLWNNYLFDSSKLKVDIGELKLVNSAPFNPQGELFDIAELLNSTPDGVLFITYDFTAKEHYKSFEKLRLGGLTLNEKFAVPVVEVDMTKLTNGELEQ